MDWSKILTDDEIHKEAIHHIDSISFWKAAVWAREQIINRLNHNAED